MVILSTQNIPVFDCPTIVILGTGGTIASTAAGKYGAFSPSAEKMQNIIIEVASHSAMYSSIYPMELSYISLLNKDSSAIDYSDLQKLGTSIGQLLADQQVKAIIVSHGTDTMEESAYWIDITIAPDKPVIFTGAMHPPAHAQFDGINNLLASIADSAQLHNGTWIRMGDNLIPAQGASKTTIGFISQTDTIKSVHLTESYKNPAVEMDSIIPIIPIIICTQGQSPQIMSLLLEQSHGLIIKAMGSGNIPPDIARLLAAKAESIPIAIVSRVHQARVNPSYESGAILQQAGIILCNFISDIQLRILLMELLRRGFNRTEIHNFLCQVGISVEKFRDDAHKEFTEHPEIPRLM